MPPAESVANVYTVESPVRSLLERRPVDVEVPEEIGRALAALEEKDR